MSGSFFGCDGREEREGGRWRKREIKVDAKRAAIRDSAALHCELRFELWHDATTIYTGSSKLN